MFGDYSLYLVTGATGYLGQIVIRKLLDAGKSVRALVMPNDPAVAELPKEAEIVVGDVTDAFSLPPFFAGEPEGYCVIHCAGIISIATRRNPKMWQVNVEGTKNVIHQCIFHHVARMICIGTVHTIPERQKGAILCETEDLSPRKVKGQYAKSKTVAAQYALAAAKTGLHISVVLPSGLIGPYDKGKGNISSAILSFCQQKLPVAVKGGYDFADVRDVADGILACCEKGRAGECYILSGHYATLQDIFAHLSRAGYGKEPRYLPLWLIKTLSPFFELASLLRKEPLFLSPYSAAILGGNVRFSCKKAERELDYHPRALEETLDDTVRWMEEEGLIPPKKKEK